MKQIRNSISIIIILLSTISCQKNDEIKIGLLIPTSTNTRWETDKEYIISSAEKMGATVISYCAENNENIQLKQATKLLNQDIDVLIVTPVNANTSAAIVREAHNHGIPVIGYDRLIKNSDLDYLVFEGNRIGNMMLDHALDVVPSGNYIIFWGDASDENATIIREAQEKELLPYEESGKINVVYRAFIENWSQENAYHLMDKILSYTNQDIDAVIASSDQLAFGALQALKKHQLSVKVLTGQDAELNALQLIGKGEMSFTVYKPIPQIAQKAVDLALDLSNRKKIKDNDTYVNNGRKEVPAFIVEPIGIDRYNIHNKLIAKNIFTEEEIFETPQ